MQDHDASRALRQQGQGLVKGLDHEPVPSLDGRVCRLVRRRDRVVSVRGSVVGLRRRTNALWPWRLFMSGPLHGAGHAGWAPFLPIHGWLAGFQKPVGLAAK
jgi:hypothetical protein